MNSLMLKKIIAEEIKKVLREEEEIINISMEDVKKLINDEKKTKNLQKYFMQNPAEIEKVINLAKKMGASSLEENIFDDIKTYKSKDFPEKGKYFNARAMSVYPIAGALSAAGYGHIPLGIAIAGAGVSFLLAYLQDVALSVKKQQK